VVVVVGLATGLFILVELNPLVGDHKYVVPPDAINVVDEPLHIVTSLPALATGNGFTVTITLSVDDPHEFDTVTVNVIVVVGLAIGLLILVELNPLIGDHKYDVPPVAVNDVWSPLHIVTLFPALATGIGFIVTVVFAQLVVPQELFHAA